MLSTYFLNVSLFRTYAKILPLILLCDPPGHTDHTWYGINRILCLMGSTHHGRGAGRPCHVLEGSKRVEGVGNRDFFFNFCSAQQPLQVDDVVITADDQAARAELFCTLSNVSMIRTLLRRTATRSCRVSSHLRSKETAIQSHVKLECDSQSQSTRRCDRNLNSLFAVRNSDELLIVKSFSEMPFGFSDVLLLQHGGRHSSHDTLKSHARRLQVAVTETMTEDADCIQRRSIAELVIRRNELRHILHEAKLVVQPWFMSSPSADFARSWASRKCPVPYLFTAFVESCRDDTERDHINLSSKRGKMAHQVSIESAPMSSGISGLNTENSQRSRPFGEGSTGPKRREFRAESKKRHRVVQAEERRAIRESRRSEKLARHIEDRRTREHEREIDRLGRLLRRASELDVTRCCNDVRTLLQARWQCGEGGLYTAPPSSSGETQPATLSVSIQACQMCPTTCLGPSLLGSTLGTVSSPAHSCSVDVRTLRIIDFVSTFRTALVWNLSLTPHLSELSAALNDVQRPQAKSHSYQASSLLHKIAIAIVTLLLPSAVRQLGLERTVQSRAAFPVNKLTWPFFARLILTSVTCREVGCHEPDVLCEIRGNEAWAYSPETESRDRYTREFLRSRGHVIAEVSNYIPKCMTSSARVRILTPRSQEHVPTLSTSLLAPSTLHKKGENTFRDGSPVLCQATALLPVSSIQTPCHITLKRYKLRNPFYLMTDHQAEHPTCHQLQPEQPPQMLAKGKIVACQAILQQLIEHPCYRCLQAQLHEESLKRSSLEAILTAVQAGRYLTVLSVVVAARAFFFDQRKQSATSDRHSAVAMLAEKFENLVRSRLQLMLVSDDLESQLMRRDKECEARCTRCLCCDDSIAAQIDQSATPTSSTRAPLQYCQSCALPHDGTGQIDAAVGCSLILMCRGFMPRIIGVIEGVQTRGRASDAALISIVHSRQGPLLHLTLASSSVQRFREFPLVSTVSLCTGVNITREAQWKYRGATSSHVTGATQYLAALTELDSRLLGTRKQWLTVLTALVDAAGSAHQVLQLLAQISETTGKNEDDLKSNHMCKLKVPLKAGRKEIAKNDGLSAACSSTPRLNKNSSAPCEAVIEAPLEAPLDVGACCLRGLYRTHRHVKMASSGGCDNPPIQAHAPRHISFACQSNQDRRKYKEALLIASVIKTACISADLESTNLRNVLSTGCIRPSLVSAAQKGILPESSNLDADMLSRLQNLNTRCGAPSNGDAPHEGRCDLCGGDYDYLNSLIGPLKNEAPRFRCDTPANSAWQKFGPRNSARVLCAHEFCADTSWIVKLSSADRPRIRGWAATCGAGPVYSSSLRGRSEFSHVDYACRVFTSPATAPTWMFIPLLLVSPVGSTNKRGGGEEVLGLPVQLSSFILCYSMPTLVRVVACNEAATWTLDVLLAVLNSHQASMGNTDNETSRTFRRIENGLSMETSRLFDDVFNGVTHRVPTQRPGVAPSRVSASHYMPLAFPGLLVRGLHGLREAELKAASGVHGTVCLLRICFVGWNVHHECWIEDDDAMFAGSVASRARLFVCHCLPKLAVPTLEHLYLDLSAWCFADTHFQSAAMQLYDNGSIHNVPTKEFETVANLRAALLLVEAAIPHAARYDWTKAKARQRTRRVQSARSPAQFVELVLLLEDEVHTAWLSDHWRALRSNLPCRTYCVKYPSYSLAALLLWTLDNAVDYRRVATYSCGSN
mmetsp:Transcript_31397/g.100856  ORF Transcript_31397/g.100856 Transcript_31397/m.100856 type:complete len:1706 (-) Transcript_31397:509-5626(-)